MFNLKSNPKLAEFLESEGITPDQIQSIEYTKMTRSLSVSKNVDTGERRYIIKGVGFEMVIDSDKDNSFFRSKIERKD